MSLNRVPVLALALSFGWVACASVHDIDAKDGIIESGVNEDYALASNTGAGDGVRLATEEVMIRSLRHEELACAAVVRLAESELLCFGSLYVSGAGASLRFDGAESRGLATNDTYKTMLFRIGENASVELAAPLSASVFRKEGAGSLVVSKPFSADVLSNGTGTVIFSYDSSSRFFLRTGSPFVYGAHSSDVDISEFTVDRALNNNASLSVDVASDLASDATELQDLLVGGGHEVRIDPNVTLYQTDVLDEPDDFLELVPDCAVVGSNSVGVLRVDGVLAGKLAIADGDASSACGAVYVSQGAVVSNWSSVVAEPLLGRHGYACLDVLGCYAAVGAWQGGIEGQLFLNVGEGAVFTHVGSSVRASGFSLGGSDARVTMLVNGGTFDAADASGNVTLPVASDAAEVTLTAENGGLVELGEKTLTANPHVRVNLDSGATLSATALAAIDDAGDPAMVQFDGGYLRALQGGNPLAGTTSAQIFAQEGGAGYDVPEGLTAEIVETGKPRAPTGRGVEAIALGANVAERAFVGPPLVVIEETGGVGRGAAAVAELSSSGEVTAVRVTGRGIDYEDPVAAKLVCGTEEVDLGEVTLSDNVAGALMKRGAGTLEVKVQTELRGLEIHEGTVKLEIDEALAEGPLYIAPGATLDVGDTHQVFNDFRGYATLVKGEGGLIELSGLTVDMNRAMTNDVDTLDLGQFTLQDGCRISLSNFSGVDRALGRYVIYHLTGDLPAKVPSIAETTYAAGLSRGWTVRLENSDLVLRYVGGSIFIFY